MGAGGRFAGLAGATLVIGGAQLVKLLVPGQRLRDAGVPRQSILAGLARRDRFLLIPVAGVFIGFCSASRAP